MLLWNIDIFKTIHPEFDIIENESHSKEWLQYMLYEHGIIHEKHNAPLYTPPPVWILHLAAGGISGPISRTITAPVDRLRIAVQTAEKEKSILKTLTELIKEGGVRSLWRGNLINVLKVGPEMSIRFGLYERIKQLISSKDSTNLTLYEKFVSGASAGVLGQLFIYPMEVIKTKLSVAKTGEYKGMYDAAKKIYAQGGVRAFYRGYKPSAMGTVPYTGIDLAAFETLKKRFVYKTGASPENKSFDIMAKVMACATVSTGVAQFLSYPLNLIKSRQQADSKHVSNTISAAERWRFCDVCQTLYIIIKTDGIKGLYRGIIPSLFKVLPASAINYTIYEYAHQFLIANLV